jgi:hypothetical protein
MKPLADGYVAEFGLLDDQSWCRILGGFLDANLYQTWQIGREPGRLFRGTRRLVLKRRGVVVAAAEVRVLLAPVLGCGISYVRWGPLWRPTAQVADVEAFRQAIRALRNEHVCRRRTILRVKPRLFVQRDEERRTVLQQEGFHTVKGRGEERTLLMDLRQDEDELRRGMDKKWRNCLSKAERSQLRVEVGTGSHPFDEFLAIYADMLDRKRFVPTADFDTHRRLQKNLPELLKMRVLLARQDGRPCAAAVISAMGDTGLYLFGATNDLGMRTCASYLVQWRAVQLLKELGASTYDLHGINPEHNPGTYHFKKGLAGKQGTEATFARQAQSFVPTATSVSILLAERWCQWGRGFKSRPRRATSFG